MVDKIKNKKRPKSNTNCEIRLIKLRKTLGKEGGKMEVRREMNRVIKPFFKINQIK